MNGGQFLLDTNILLDYPNIFDDLKDSEFIIHSIVCEEIDNIIHNSLDEEKKFKARQARNSIKNAKNKKYSINFPNVTLPPGWDKEKNDNKLLAICKDLKVKLFTNDLAMQVKADSLNVQWKTYGQKANTYVGYKELSGDTHFINQLFEEIEHDINRYKFLINEYLILYNKDLNTVNEYRFDGQKLVDLKLPPSKIVKALNSKQRLALDLLNNKDIPIKIIAGGFGSGKSLLSVKTGLYHVAQKEYYKTLLFLRNPLTADGTDIGFLPGSKEDKISDYMQPFLQYVENDKDQFYIENLMKNEKIKMDVVSFLKGVSLEDSFVIMDEAEDLNIKLIKLVGSRIGKNSCIVFTGDWNQCENKYKYNNGLLKIIDSMKNNHLVGVVTLDEDVRSPASKLFANL